MFVSYIRVRPGLAHQELRNILRMCPCDIHITKNQNDKKRVLIKNIKLHKLHFDVITIYELLLSMLLNKTFL